MNKKKDEMVKELKELREGIFETSINITETVNKLKKIATDNDIEFTFNDDDKEFNELLKEANDLIDEIDSHT